VERGAACLAARRLIGAIDARETAPGTEQPPASRGRFSRGAGCAKGVPEPRVCAGQGVAITYSMR